MTINDVLIHFRTSYNMGVVTGISFSNVQYWKKIGFIPYKMQLRLEKLTKGVLKASIDDTNYKFSKYKK